MFSFIITTPFEDAKRKQKMGKRKRGIVKSELLLLL
jgi:hypothetical protein